MLIRDATGEDWPAIWAFMREIVAAGETFCWARETSEAAARAMWFNEPPGSTLVAVDPDGTIMGTAEISPNQGGGGAHIANAGFMVSARFARRGVGGALCRHALERARADGFRGMQFNAVVETNTGAVALWRSLGFSVLATVPEGFHHPVKGYVGLHIMYRAL
jgi:ribosomal protein S18 acetylase RimI-like enzyme